MSFSSLMALPPRIVIDTFIKMNQTTYIYVYLKVCFFLTYIDKYICNYFTYSIYIYIHTLPSLLTFLSEVFIYQSILCQFIF